MNKIIKPNIIMNNSELIKIDSVMAKLRSQFNISSYASGSETLTAIVSGEAYKIAIVGCGIYTDINERILIEAFKIKHPRRPVIVYSPKSHNHCRVRTTRADHNVHMPEEVLEMARRYL